MTSRIEGDHEFIGNISITGTASLPAASVKNQSFSSVSTDRLGVDKAIHQFPVGHRFELATTPTDGLYIVFIARANGTIRNFEVAANTAQASTAAATLVDLMKATSSSTFVSVLSAGVEAAAAARTVYAGTINTSTLIDGDILAVKYTTAGTSGNRSAGVGAVVTIYENPS